MASGVLSVALPVLHGLIVAGLLIRVITQRPPVGVAVAWLAVILSMPFVGATLYLLFGEKWLGRQRPARTAACLPEVKRWLADLRTEAETSADALDSDAEPLRRQAEQVLGFPAMGGNEIELLHDFQTVFDTLIADIDDAAARCYLCFYIWHEGGRMSDLVDALIRAAARGVECHALADAVGSAAFLTGPVPQRLREAGVELTPALPTGSIRSFLVRRDLRNHRKIVVIDDRIAYTGSQNLVDPRFFKQDSGVGEWIDAMVRVTGPVAAALEGVFKLDWSVETGRALALPPLDVSPTPEPGGSTIQVVPSGPDLRPEAIHQLLLTAIYAARRELVMTTPYFVPDDAILTALLSAALRGVQVTLIVPARNDSILVRYASVAHFDDLASAGVHIRLFDGGLLHTKSLTIDTSVSIFGSVNLDMRSLWLNFEISLFVYDPTFTARLKNLQATYIQDSRPLDLAKWRRRPPSRRFTENAFRLLGPLL